MIGYYVHHVGRGHLHRAQALATVLRERRDEVTGLSSLEAPPGWPGEWVVLPRDDDGDPRDVTAHGHLHWAPLHHDGLRSRMSAMSAWIEAARPDAMVADVSVEVLLLARLHGVPTVAVVLPGRRDDAAHTFGLGTAQAIVGFWPARADGMTPGLAPAVRDRLVPLGALARPSPRPAPAGPGPDGTPTPEDPATGPTVVLLLGTGGHGVTARDVDAARAATPGWRWTVMDGSAGTWVADPAPVLAAADVVITHAGQNALAETAAARRPAIVLPQDRPHREQATTGDVLRDGWPAVVLDRWPDLGWPDLLEQARGLDGEQWAEWCDGRAADRFADVVTALRRPAAVGA